MTELSVYVPADPDHALGIRPGSAIVGSTYNPPNVDIGSTVLRIDYEGGVYHSMTFEEKLLHASDRHLWNNGRGYPTVARMLVEPETMVEVGTYETDTRQLVCWDAESTRLLEEWKARAQSDGN